MNNIMSDDGCESEGITNTPANVHHLRLQQKEHPSGTVRPFWSRQDICGTQDIRTGFIMNRSHGWYPSHGDCRRAQKVALRELETQGITVRDFADESTTIVKKVKQAAPDLSKSRIAVRRRGEAKDDLTEKGSLERRARDVCNDTDVINVSSTAGVLTNIVVGGLKKSAGLLSYAIGMLRWTLGFSGNDNDKNNRHEIDAMVVRTNYAVHLQ